MLPELTVKHSTFVLYADNTSFIFAIPRPEEFTTKLNNVITVVYGWFTINFLSLNLNKTTYLQFLTKNKEKPNYLLHS